MGYADYAFYQKEYYGDIIAEDDFPKWSERASRQIDVLTFRRLQSAYPKDEYTDRQIKMCVCELAEKMMETDKYLKASSLDETGKPGIIKSVSAGSESISYATGENIYASVVKDENSKTAFFRKTVVNYLSDLTDGNGICLLYAGV